ncbi:hypothetical protein ACLKA6_005823 [Drosophila palustris]
MMVMPSDKPDDESSTVLQDVPASATGNSRPGEELESESIADEQCIEEGAAEEQVRRGPGRPKRVHTGRRGRPRKTYNTLNAMTRDDIDVPESYSEALDTSHAEDWKSSMQKEMDSLRANDTWSLVELPKDETAIGCKWVYAVKRVKFGNVERYKSRLVAKG